MTRRFAAVVDEGPVDGEGKASGFRAHSSRQSNGVFDRCPEVLPYLGLPPGWRFRIAPGHSDVWDDPELLTIDRH